MTPSTVPTAGSTIPAQSSDRKSGGLSTGAKAGVGVGIGLGIPIIVGAVAAWYFLSKRRKSRASMGPYETVMTNEKGRTDSGSYGSPHMAPHEMQPMSSGAPFLPAIATHDLSQDDRQYEATPATTASHEPQYRDEPALAAATEKPYSSPQQDPYYAAQERPATSRDVSRGGTPPPLETQTRPATAPHHLAPVDDEPPSPVSPVSPISPAGSRSASLRHSVERNDL